MKNVFHSEGNFFSLYGLKQFFRRKHIQVVVANYGITGAKIWKACAQVNVPLIVHFHGFDAFHHDTLQQYAASYKEMFTYARYIIAVSEDMKKQLIRLGAEPQKVKNIPYGIDLSFFTPGKPELNPPVFVAVGRFTAKKAPHHTIRAFEKVVQAVPEARLIMVGDGELMVECQKLATKLGIQNKITFAGVLTPDEIKQLLHQARAFVQHSVTAPDGDKEGTPNSILEAAACGLPVISTYHAGIPEAVIHEKTGFLVEEGDVQGMAKYMIELATNPGLAKELGETARKHIEQHYTQEIQIHKIAELIYACLPDRQACLQADGLARDKS
ncbi:glycosyltransferase [Thermoflavifilum thermophilum]|nr:glycosyltransferase [Thermoflavifilum thermophilum]